MDLIRQAYELKRSSIQWFDGIELDPSRSYWLIRNEAWMRLRHESRASGHGLHSFDEKGHPRNDLLGIPVRVTIDDLPDTPDIQLVMQPQQYRPGGL